jgi:CHAT domain-containing protein/tetratricopeptide (TPR) repeat protein
MGQHARAEPLFQRSLKIREARLPRDHLDVAIALNNLAALYQAMGQHARAEPLFQRSLKIREARLPRDHLDVATALNNLANLYAAMGKHDRAEPLLRRCLKIREGRLPRDHPDLARSLNTLAGLYRDMGRYARAEPLYKRSLAIVEAKLPRDHPDVAQALNNLAGLYRDMGQDARAEPLLQRSLAIWEAKLPGNHPHMVTTLNNLAGLYTRTDRQREAGRLFDRARRAARQHLAAVLPALSDSEKADFFANTAARSHLEAALALGLVNKGDAELAGLSASWLVNGKAVDQESLASSLLLARQSKDPELGKRATRLLAVREQLARLTLATPRPGQEKQRPQQIEELSNEEQQLARRLRRAGSHAAPPLWVELAELRKALPADAVLIDIAHFQVFDFKARPGKEWQPARYAAWLTPKTGPVRLIDLGPAGKIDAAVQAFRTAMQAAPRRIKGQGEQKAEQALREQLAALSALLLKPLLPQVGKAKRWLISPDGNLWLLPFEALTLPDGKFAVEKYHISYLTSGRDLLAGPAPKVKRTAPLVLADPDYDAGTAGLPRRRSVARPGSGEPLRAAALRLGDVPRLPGTAAEAKAITPSLQGYARLTPRVYLGRRAREEVVKAARGPRVLVLCTHGFFLPDQEVKRDRPVPSRTRASRKWENPLLRCGLLLAGCNNAARAKSGDDGVLSGLEVVGSDLRGCELVVLSACETGLGEVQVGEGVAGLRQAFQLAGAKAVVSTLWQVPDKQSARLMALFFRNLSKGMSKPQALRSAKLQIIAERREDFAAAHPFFWAAFTLTGES